jgi:hypothetical protein
MNKIIFTPACPAWAKRRLAGAKDNEEVLRDCVLAKMMVESDAVRQVAGPTKKRLMA